jgi:NAD(P) transhydrogenase subunit alpha
MVDKETKIFAIDPGDELVKATLLTHGGQVVHPNFAGKAAAPKAAAKPAAKKAAAPKKAAPKKAPAKAKAAPARKPAASGGNS